MDRPLYVIIARTFGAWQRTKQSLESKHLDDNERENKQDWLFQHAKRITELVADCMPSGSGVDAGTHFDFDCSRENRLVFNTSYHHMNGESGVYDGWTEHNVIVTPDLEVGINIKITGRDRNQIKDYLADIYLTDLTALHEEWERVTEKENKS